MSFPVTANVGDSLKVEVHLHSIFLGDRDRQCWTYLTKGMAGHGQREMSLTLLIDEDADTEAFPKTPVKMFEILFSRTASGKVVDLGDATLLGQKGIFGFPCLFYAPAIQFDELPSLDDHLGLLLVHQSEYDYARQYGFTRFLSRLGKYCSSFPYPTWNTQVRPSLFDEATAEPSLLTEQPHTLLDHSCAHQRENVLQLQLHKLDAEAVSAALQDDVALLNTTFSPRCDASLYWQPEQVGTGAYSAPDVGQATIGGSFVMIRRSDTTSQHITEDGFELTLSESAWHDLKEAIDSGQSFSTRTGEDGRFLLDYLDSSATHQARRYEPRATWLSLANIRPVVHMQPYINLSGENSFSERINADELTIYLTEIETCLNLAMSEETERFTLFLEVTLYPAETNVDVDADIPLNNEFVSFVQNTITSIEPCSVTAQIRLRIPFQIN